MNSIEKYFHDNPGAVITIEESESGTPLVFCGSYAKLLEWAAFYRKCDLEAPKSAMKYALFFSIEPDFMNDFFNLTGDELFRYIQL